MEPLISVIVPVYNIETYLRECLDSVVGQSYKNLEIILIDDGSTDSSGAICDEYARNDARVRVIHQSNHGLPYTRNVGMDAASGEWIAFPDADDWLEPDAYSKLVSVINGEAADADIIIYDICREFREESKRTGLGVPGGMIEGELLDACRVAPFYKLIYRGKVIRFTIFAAWNKLYRREFLRSKGLRFRPEVKKGEDLVFSADMLNDAQKIYYKDEVLYHHRIISSSWDNRYRPDMVEQVRLQLAALAEIIERRKLPDRVRAMFQCYTSTRLYTCMRQYLFHPDNPHTPKERMREFIEVANSEPFASAIANADLSYMSAQEKLFVWLMRHRQYALCRMLAQLRAGYSAKSMG